MQKMSYSSRIKAFREARRLTHQQFADAVGVTRGAVQQWEKGATGPKRFNQPAVAKFMGISVSELMSEDSPGLPLAPKQAMQQPETTLPQATVINAASSQPTVPPDAARLAISSGQHTLSAEALTLGLLYDTAPISGALKIQLFRRCSELLLGIERPASSPASAALEPGQTPKKSAA